MNTPFGIPPDINKLSDYVEAHSPEQTLTDCKKWDCDPTDILCIADIIAHYIKQNKHAITLYQHGIAQLEAHPELIAADTDLACAYGNLGILLYCEGNAVASLKYLERSCELNEDNLNILSTLAISSFDAQRYVQCYLTIKKLYGRPIDEIEEKLHSRMLTSITEVRNIIEDENRLVQNLSDVSQVSHNEAIERMAKSLFAEAIPHYSRAIDFYEQLLAFDKQINNLHETSIRQINMNYSFALMDRGKCKLQVDQRHVNPAVHDFIKALLTNPELSDAAQNILFCMEIINSFFQFRLGQFPAGKYDANFLHHYDIGYDALKTPFPAGTPGRNWEKAVFALQKAISYDSNQSIAYHLLGLAYEGSKMNNEAAITAWLTAYRLDPKLNFEFRSKITIV